MFTSRPCGCKGVRSCKICETQYGARNKPQLKNKNSSESAFTFCTFCNKCYQGLYEDPLAFHQHHQESVCYNIDGIKLVLDFISDDEERDLLHNIDKIPWNHSQSGRYKQNYGPKCNFKKKKVSSVNFNGYPLVTKFIQEKFKDLELLNNFQTVEQCSLDYCPDRGSSIDPHIDDCWIWGERIPTLSLASDSFLTLSKFESQTTRYNLDCVDSYNSYLLHDRKNSARCNENTPEPQKVVTGASSITDTSASNMTKTPVIRIPMPRRSLLILYGDARYYWEHAILREDITKRRVCITYRELTLPFLFGQYSNIGEDITRKSKQFF